jgi:lipoprotein-anchoring transpeptidase ErfK/SrfK
VLAPELKNGDVAWVRDDKVGNIGAVNWEIKADLSKRRILVYHANKVVRKVTIGVGRVGHATPTGRFAVTDRLRVTDPSSPYGCCVLALTGHQTHLPDGWPGGDRLAIHATQDLSGLGKRVSLGCMRTDPRDTRWLLKRIPVGTPVSISA